MLCLVLSTTILTSYPSQNLGVTLSSSLFLTTHAQLVTVF